MARHRQEHNGFGSRHSLLVAICHRDAVDHLDPALAEPLRDRSYRRAFLDLASSHRVLGLTVSVLTRARAIDWRSGPDGRELDDLLRTLRRRTAMFEMQRDQVVAVLSSAGVRHVVLKGAAIAPVFYERPIERDTADLDILIREDQLERSLRALEADGYAGPSSPDEYHAYRRHHFHIQLKRPGAYIVEIHWALTRVGAPFQADASEVLAQATRFERPGHPLLLFPRPEHTLLHLVLQNLQEGFSRLARAVDVDRIVAATPELDWDVLVAAAQQADMASPTAVSLQLAHRLLGAAVPEGVLEELRPGRVARFHVAVARPVQSLLSQRLQWGLAAKHLHDLWLLGSVGKRIRLLRQVLDADPALSFPQRARPGALRRLAGLGKLVLLQSWFYLAAALSQITPAGRARLRFW